MRKNLFIAGLIWFIIAIVVMILDACVFQDEFKKTGRTKENARKLLKEELIILIWPISLIFGICQVIYKKLILGFIDLLYLAFSTDESGTSATPQEVSIIDIIKDNQEPIKVPTFKE